MSHEWDPLDTQNGTRLPLRDKPVILKSGPPCILKQKVYIAIEKNSVAVHYRVPRPSQDLVTSSVAARLRAARSPLEFPVRYASHTPRRVERWRAAVPTVLFFCQVQLPLPLRSPGCPVRVW